MKTKNIKEELDKIVSKKPSKWLEKAELRANNEAWLDKSAEIALKILRILRAKKMSQIELAEKLKVTPQYVSRIVKGKENLTLETISNLEKELGFELISIPTYHFDIEIEDFPAHTYSLPNNLKTPPSKVQKEYYAEQSASYLPEENNQVMAA